jgi:hypothetical protein
MTQRERERERRESYREKAQEGGLFQLAYLALIYSSFT